jgi:hypothetical protein
MASLLSPADKETVTTVTKLEIELQRSETVTQITCSQCSRTGEVRKVEFTPPASIGSAISFQRVPDGWWLHGSAMFSVKATCPDCFEQRLAVGIRSDSKAEGAPSTREEPDPKAPMDSDHDSLGEPPPFDAASIIEADAPEPHPNASKPGAARDLFERVERVCEHGGSVLVSGSTAKESRRAYVKLSNDHGIDLTASATGKTMVAALKSALAKAGL